MGDTRRPMSDRQSIAIKLMRLLKCCLGNLAYKFKSRVDAFMDFFKVIWQRRFWLFAKSTVPSNHYCETRHARNKKACRTDKTGWPTFTAKSVNSDSKSSMRSALFDTPPEALPIEYRPSVIEDAPRLAIEDGDDTAMAACVRSPLQLFHQHCIVVDRLEGNKVSPISAGYWKKVKEKWKELPVDEQRSWDTNFQQLCNIRQSRQAHTRSMNALPSSSRSTPTRAICDRASGTATLALCDGADIAATRGTRRRQHWLWHGVGVGISIGSIGISSLQRFTGLHERCRRNSPSGFCFAACDFVDAALDGCRFLPSWGSA